MPQSTSHGLVCCGCSSKHLLWMCPVLEVNRLRYQSTQGHLEIAFLTSPVRRGQCLGDRDLPTSRSCCCQSTPRTAPSMLPDKKSTQVSHSLSLFNSSLPIILFFLFSCWADQHGNGSGYRDEACLFNLCLSLKCCLVTP